MTEPSDSADELTPLRRAFVAVEMLQTKLARLEAARTEPLAIIGLGCRFPGGAADPERFWRLLRDGVDAVTEVPRDRWNGDELYDPDPAAPGKTSTRCGAFIDDVYNPPVGAGAFYLVAGRPGPLHSRSTSTAPITSRYSR